MIIKDAGAPAATAPPVPRRHLPQLEGMRGLAALGVLTLHVALATGQTRWDEYPGYEQAGSGYFSALLQQLTVSLPIFFTLSGLLLYRPFAQSTLAGTARPALRPYLWRRALRTLPAYWVLITVTLLTVNRDSVTGLWDVVRPVLLLQIYSDEGRMTSAGAEQTWSLSTEIAFYFALPLLAAGLHLLARGAADAARRLRRILVALAVPVVVAVAYTAWVHQESMGMWPIQQLWAPKWIGFIALGMALAALTAAAEAGVRPLPAAYAVLSRRPVVCWGLALACYLLLTVSPVGDPGSSNYPGSAQAVVELVGQLLFALFAVLPLATAAGGSRLTRAVLANPVVLFLGRVSYGVYLWHIAVIYFLNGSMMGAGSFAVFWPQVLAWTLLAATASYYLVERPAMALRDRLGGPPAGTTPTVSAGPAGRR